MRSLKKTIKRICVDLSRKSAAFDRLYASVIRRKRQKTFDKYSDIPVDSRLVVFEAFKGTRYADSPKAVYEFLLADRRFDEFRFVWALRGQAAEEFGYLEDNDRTSIVKWGSDDYYRTYAEAGWWFANTRIPESIVKKPGQTYVQCWHGTPLKKIGCDLVGDSTEDRARTAEVVHKDVKRYSYLISPSAYFTEKITSAMDLKAAGKEDTVIETGYPRNDFIVNHTAEDAERVRKQLGISADSKVILYAPTFREDQRTAQYGYRYEEPLDFGRFLEHIGPEYVILFRAHYHIADAFDFAGYGGRILDVSRYPEVNDLYIVSDMLITDYSSVLFDYSILRRPMIFYMYDLEYYRDELRGMYMQVCELPGPVVKTQEELEQAVLEAEVRTKTAEYNEEYDRFGARFTYLDDGNATKRVVETVFGRQ